MEKYLNFRDNFDITITCASGVEKALKSELKRLGYEDAPAINGALTFNGGMLDIARCNLFLRTADRVYIKVADFSADTFDLLFDGVKSVRWEDFIPPSAKIIVNGKCVKSKLFAISVCQSIVKKAIVDRLSKKYNQRLYETGAEYGVEFSIFKDQVSLYINTSGVGLHKRGYRDLVGIAPIRETLASAMILLSDFYYKNPFLDPFCGSGTIAIESARIAMNIAGGINRRFAFNDWDNFDKKYYDLAREEALDKENRSIKTEFFASDIDPKAIKLAKRHAERAGVADKIRFSVCDVKNVTCPLSNGTIVTNPPYGERVFDREQAKECNISLGKLYKSLDNWSAFVITSANSFSKDFGKKPDKERKLYNSNRECKFYYYYKNKQN
ncbi:MAG: class I SAM-dependent RNA methyltransferase [Clostridiales bacterium]|nr:class I SAM-dependent RNA methyltransferase [Clostridiales bacterium]